MTLLRQDEGEPNQWPSINGLSQEAGDIDPAAVWRRIEHWIAYRWGQRSVTWIVSDEGDWLPPLRPYTVDQAYRWAGTQYEPVTLDNGPLGLILPGGMVKIEATAGSTDPPPDDVNLAAVRLAEYWAEVKPGEVAAATGSIELGPLSFDSGKPSTWTARAMQYSGAADLLRRYRRP